jgi:hypothetical protein
MPKAPLAFLMAGVGFAITLGVIVLVGPANSGDLPEARLRTLHALAVAYVPLCQSLRFPRYGENLRLCVWVTQGNPGLPRAQRRGRDLNPRRTLQHVRDFQSRSLDHSDTSPSEGQGSR